MRCIGHTVVLCAYQPFMTLHCRCTHCWGRHSVLNLILQVIPPLFAIFSHRHGGASLQCEDVHSLVYACDSPYLPTCICMYRHSVCKLWYRCACSTHSLLSAVVCGALCVCFRAAASPVCCRGGGWADGNGLAVTFAEYTPTLQGHVCAASRRLSWAFSPSGGSHAQRCTTMNIACGRCVSCTALCVAWPVLRGAHLLLIISAQVSPLLRFRPGPACPSRLCTGRGVSVCSHPSADGLSSVLCCQLCPIDAIYLYVRLCLHPCLRSCGSVCGLELGPQEGFHAPFLPCRFESMHGELRPSPFVCRMRRALLPGAGGARFPSCDVVGSLPCEGIRVALSPHRQRCVHDNVNCTLQ